MLLFGLERIPKRFGKVFLQNGAFLESLEVPDNFPKVPQSAKVRNFRRNLRNFRSYYSSSGPKVVKFIINSL
jgi:hypothetical protein